MIKKLREYFKDLESNLNDIADLLQRFFNHIYDNKNKMDKSLITELISILDKNKEERKRLSKKLQLRYSYKSGKEKLEISKKLNDLSRIEKILGMLRAIRKMGVNYKREDRVIKKIIGLKRTDIDEDEKLVDIYVKGLKQDIIELNTFFELKESSLVKFYDLIRGVEIALKNFLGEDHYITDKEYYDNAKTVHRYGLNILTILKNKKSRLNKLYKENNYRNVADHIKRKITNIRALVRGMKIKSDLVKRRLERPVKKIKSLKRTEIEEDFPNMRADLYIRKLEHYFNRKEKNITQLEGIFISFNKAIDTLIYGGKYKESIALISKFLRILKQNRDEFEKIKADNSYNYSDSQGASGVNMENKVKDFRLIKRSLQNDLESKSGRLQRSIKKTRELKRTEIEENYYENTLRDYIDDLEKVYGFIKRENRNKSLISDYLAGIVEEIEENYDNKTIDNKILYKYIIRVLNLIKNNRKVVDNERIEYYISKLRKLNKEIISQPKNREDRVIKKIRELKRTEIDEELSNYKATLVSSLVSQLEEYLKNNNTDLLKLDKIFHNMHSELNAYIFYYIKGNEEDKKWARKALQYINKFLKLVNTKKLRELIRRRKDLTQKEKVHIFRIEQEIRSIRKIKEKYEKIIRDNKKYTLNRVSRSADKERELRRTQIDEQERPTLKMQIGKIEKLFKHFIKTKKPESISQINTLVAQVIVFWNRVYSRENESIRDLGILLEIIKKYNKQINVEDYPRARYIIRDLRLSMKKIRSMLNKTKKYDRLTRSIKKERSLRRVDIDEDVKNNPIFKLYLDKLKEAYEEEDYRRVGEILGVILSKTVPIDNIKGSYPNGNKESYKFVNTLITLMKANNLNHLDKEKDPMLKLYLTIIKGHLSDLRTVKRRIEKKLKEKPREDRVIKKVRSLKRTEIDENN